MFAALRRRVLRSAAALPQGRSRSRSFFSAAVAAAATTSMAAAVPRQEPVAEATAAAVSPAHTHIPEAEFPSAPGQILNWWFGKQGDKHHLQFRGMWFQSTPKIDEELRRLFSAPLKAAQAGGLSSWEAHPETMAAKIILMDQFSRNIHRGSAEAFRGDAEALRCTLKGIALDQKAGAKQQQQFFRALPDMMRYFCLMPLMHAEDLAMQELGEEHFKTLSFFSTTALLQQAVAQHKEMIVKFGRFPHRNAILGRVNTPAEAAYLSAGNAHDYGQKAATSK